MAYKVTLKRSAEKELDSLSDVLRRRITDKLLSLEVDPHPRGSKKLLGQQAYRLRVGDYRVLYEVDDAAALVTVFAVGHRRDVYR